MRGLRPVRLNPINRGCVNRVVVNFKKKCKFIDKTESVFYFTVKTEPWDNDNDDSDALIKKVGVVDEKEKGRVVFELDEKECYLDPDDDYFFDVVEVDGDGNVYRHCIGEFNVIGGANNAQAGGLDE